METKAPRITDVARLAGVSTATVSRALSKPETVAESTRNAVLAAAEKSGYRVNLSARNLRRQRTGAIVVLVPNLGNPFFSEILAGIEVALSDADINMLVVDTRQAHTKPQLVLEYLHASRADGIIALDGSLPDEILSVASAGTGAPPIIFACEWPPKDAFFSVRANNSAGAGLAIAHLVGLGHRQIGMLAGPPENVLTRSRSAGAETEMVNSGLALDPSHLFFGDFSLESGARAAQAWLRLDHRPSAVFCQSDQMAFGFISELARNDVAVPGDVSVVGFDDIDIARRFIPALTTVCQPRKKLGLYAAKMLIDHVQTNTSPAIETTILEVELIVRDSTRQLAG
ncbi:LacI family DNA-binding transcriptional regulator [Hoeflea sp. YIM 152468]|uniref:LacI family DNA-binding transcriptional regulator n=1 Tax=Hoeflea sp. YIM 152468 TaxID=3031759 RepID=UPI0023D9F5E7|nr:LacI family DNA-binding transcriptional regulator [Hoeflea sp. YIM 152468]MDF1610392.1 LacI family DNA-binding transcriptional regulator [Hoeflea sp. YIM 152468]